MFLFYSLPITASLFECPTALDAVPSSGAHPRVTSMMYYLTAYDAVIAHGAHPKVTSMIWYMVLT